MTKSSCTYALCILKAGINVCMTVQDFNRKKRIRLFKVRHFVANSECYRGFLKVLAGIRKNKILQTRKIV